MVNIEHIQKMLFLFEEKKRLVTIKSEKYDILLEPLPDINTRNIKNNRTLLTLRAKKPIDIAYTLNKIIQYKYKDFNLSYYMNMLQISYIIDNNMISIDKLETNISLMESII